MEADGEAEVDGGLHRIVISEMEAPNMLVDLVPVGERSGAKRQCDRALGRGRRGGGRRDGRERRRAARVRTAVSLCLMVLRCLIVVWRVVRWDKKEFITMRQDRRRRVPHMPHTS